MIKTLITFVIAACGFIGYMDNARAAGGPAPAAACGALPHYTPEGVDTICVCAPKDAGWGGVQHCGWIFVSNK